DGVVAGVADAAAEEARQAVQGRGAVGGQLLLQEQERVGVLQLDEAAGPVQLDAAAERLEAQERARAEEAVAAQALAADDALEQERPVALLDLAEGADRGERVAGELAVDRHQVALAGEADELVERRVVAHGGLGGGTQSAAGPARVPRAQPGLDA